MSSSTHLVFSVHGLLQPLANRKVLATSEDISLRADFPFPPRRWELVYFEITIPRIDDTVKWDSTDFVSLGFCGEFCDLTQAQPGWNVWSVGYHGDNGGIYEEKGSQPTYSTERKFGPGDTVGCGIDYDTEEYFFTLGAEVVGTFLANFLYDRDLLIVKCIQPTTQHLRSFTGSYTLLLVTVDKLAKSS